MLSELILCLLLGQGEEDFDAVKQKALNCGASKVHVVDLRKEFVTGIVEISVIAGIFLIVCYYRFHFPGSQIERNLRKSLSTRNFYRSPLHRKSSSKNCSIRRC